MGHAVAEVAARRGASVTLVTTAARGRRPGSRSCRSRPRQEMYEAVLRRGSPDRRDRDGRRRRRLPAQGAAGEKLRKADGVPEIVLEPTPDILAELGAARRRGQMLVGFAAETETVCASTRPRSCAPSASTSSSPTTSPPPTPGSRSTRTGRSCWTPPAASRRRRCSKAALAGVILERVARWPGGADLPRPGHHEAGVRREHVHVHLGVGDRGSSGQDGGPDLRRVLDAIFDEDPTAGWPARPWSPPDSSSSRARSAPGATSTSPRVVRDTVREHRLRPRVVRLRRQDLRRHHLDRRAVARHRQGVDKAVEQRAGTGDHYDESAPATRG